MQALNSPSVYESPLYQARLQAAKEALIKAGIKYPKVRIGCAYAPPLARIPSDQYWVQRFLLR